MCAISSDFYLKLTTFDNIPLFFFFFFPTHSWDISAIACLSYYCSNQNINIFVSILHQHTQEQYSFLTFLAQKRKIFSVMVPNII